MAKRKRPKPKPKQLLDLALVAPPRNSALSERIAQQLAAGGGMVPLDVVAERSAGLGYERVQTHSGSTYKDQSVVVIVPAIKPEFHHRVVQGWDGMIFPMNQKRAKIFCIGDEVGHAYDNMIKQIIADPNLSSWKYILTLEHDNIIPPDAFLRLQETIEAFKFDAVGGIYWTKGELNMPMAYGDPEEYKKTGVLDFRPRDVRAALAAGHVMPVNGLAMGCTLYRMELFKQTEPPWFVTVSDIVDGKPQGFTQDLYACRRWCELGKRFAVDLRVRVGHLDLQTGTVY